MLMFSGKKRATPNTHTCDKSFYKQIVLIPKKF